MFLTSRVPELNIPRNSEYTLRFQILDEGKKPLELSGEESIRLVIQRSWTDYDSVLEIKGTIYQGSEGKVLFQFVPADTKQLVSRAYDIVVLVDDWPAYSGRLGLQPGIPGGEE